MYIMENVAENGYDTTRFNKFFSEKYSKLAIILSFVM